MRTATRPDLQQLPAIVAATRLEAVAARLWARGVEVRRGGIALRDLDGGADLPERVISCGLAGSLVETLEPGQVVVPEFVTDAAGRRFPCDGELRRQLLEGSLALGSAPVGGGLLTAPTLVVGRERAALRLPDVVAVDMEAALLAERGHRVAAVKVILDSPGAEISPGWSRPARRAVRPGSWRELAWLARAAPSYASRAGRIAAWAAGAAVAG